MTVLLIIFCVVIVIFILFKLSLRPANFPPGNSGYIAYENLTIFCNPKRFIKSRIKSLVVTFSERKQVPKVCRCWDIRL